MGLSKRTFHTPKKMPNKLKCSYSEMDDKLVSCSKKDNSSIPKSTCHKKANFANKLRLHTCITLLKIQTYPFF